MNFSTEQIGQVQSGSWDVALADITVGKLSAIALVVPGGRAALAPLYKARTVSAASWPDPFGKPPRGARVRTGNSKSAIPDSVWKACVTGLAFWRIRLSEEAPPVLTLFVYEDGSLAIWGPDVFPRGAPFKLPAPAPDQEVISIVSDAATVGYAFYVGVPWIPPQPGSVHLGL